MLPCDQYSYRSYATPWATKGSPGGLTFYDLRAMEALQARSFFLFTKTWGKFLEYVTKIIDIDKKNVKLYVELFWINADFNHLYLY